MCALQPLKGSLLETAVPVFPEPALLVPLLYEGTSRFVTSRREGYAYIRAEVFENPCNQGVFEESMGNAFCGKKNDAWISGFFFLHPNKNITSDSVFHEPFEVPCFEGLCQMSQGIERCGDRARARNAVGPLSRAVLGFEPPALLCAG